MNANAGLISEPLQRHIQLRVSRHALRRARERLHWDRGATRRMANRALTRGLVSNVATGSLRQLFLSMPSADGSSYPFLYGEHIYVFVHNVMDHEVVLLTIYRAARQLIRATLNRARRECAPISGTVTGLPAHSPSVAPVISAPGFNELTGERNSK